MSFRVPERYRATDRTKHGVYATTTTDGNNGLFLFNFGAGAIRVIASDGGGWEHVSVSLHHRCPSWDEMCKIKSLFWGEEDVVVQFHPRKSEYVTLHPYCLHLWRSTDCEFPTPHYGMVGPKQGQTIEQAEREYRQVTA